VRYSLGRKERAASTSLTTVSYTHLDVYKRQGYVNEEETAAVLQEINDYRPNILMVGMGMPLQERWIHKHRRSISANVIFPVGAFMDYKAEAIPTPPRWLASLYLEWMYRLVTEPRRLWRRYLVEPWWVFAGLARYSLTHRPVSYTHLDVYKRQPMACSPAATSVKSRWSVDAPANQ